MSLYAADGSINITVVDGTTLTGLQAPDGSYNVVLSDGTLGSVYHPCGAFRVTPIYGGPVGVYAPDGSLYVSPDGYYGTGAMKVTVVSGSISESLSSVLTRLGLTANLVLDAGDANSYTSGQSWLDLSGNDYDFFLGADGSATATDPTFNGVAGGLSSDEYWSFDGGDYFTYDDTNETWMQNFHKNAIKGWSVAWVNPGSVASAQALFGTSDSASTGFYWFLGNTNAHGIAVRNAGTLVLNQNMPTSLSTGTWHFVAFSIDESVGTGGLIWVTDSLTDTDDSTYTAPATGNATYTMQIGARGNGNLPMLNTSRMAMIGVGEGSAPTATKLLEVYNATRGRFAV